MKTKTNKLTVQKFKKLVLDVLNESTSNLKEEKTEGPNLELQLREFYQLYQKFQTAKTEFEQIQNEFKVAEDFVRQTLENLDESEEKMLQLENIIVKIKRKGFERTDYKYKEISEELYSRVNPQIRAIIDEIMESNKKITYIKSSIEVKSSDGELNEIALFRKAKEFFSDILSKLSRKLSLGNSNLDDSINYLENLSY